jgi:hypothetical protein
MRRFFRVDGELVRAEMCWWISGIPIRALLAQIDEISRRKLLRRRKYYSTGQCGVRVVKSRLFAVFQAVKGVYKDVSL